MENNLNKQSYNMTGLFALSLRLVVGWTYFSAFWRRLIIANKLNPEEAGYIGEKFNHFLPNALGIDGIIEYLVSNPEVLWWAMAAFTIIEGIVGLFIMLGMFTRLMSFGVFSLAIGILLGSGWIGTTCLDEWQIGVLGVASGFMLFFIGSGYYSVDKYFMDRKFKFTKTKWFPYVGSGVLPIKKMKKIVLTGALGIFFLTLYTNQHFHGGVFGTLHNKSVKPKIEISNASIQNNQLKFEIYRVEGADVYGSFLIGIQLLDESGTIVLEKKGDDLARYPLTHIENHYVAKIKPGAHSLIIPLGAKADLTIDLQDVTGINGSSYTLKLIDISGAEWEIKIDR
ncbi:MAG TPA: TQO small subunit DoxD [Marinilabiliaceae bacterium]|nr:TQO small subunit DoxD [Marinilabiliaceae bacterium]